MKLVTNNLTNQAYDILKKQIISNTLKPGTRLVDTQLAKEFGISRTPIRDALLRLCNDGLVVMQDNKGYFVFKPTKKDVDDIFELRQIMDVAAVTKLITEKKQLNKEELDILETAYKNSLNSIKGNNFVKADEDFHTAIVQLCNNTRFLNIYLDICSYTRVFRIHTSADKDRTKKAIAMHKEIYQAIIKGDLDAAISAIKVHIKFSIQDAYADL